MPVTLEPVERAFSQLSLKNLVCRKVPTAAKGFEKLVSLKVNEDLPLSKS